jgi:hypothetical protein
VPGYAPDELEFLLEESDLAAQRGILGCELLAGS